LLGTILGRRGDQRVFARDDHAPNARWQVIDYRLRVRGFSVQWRSGITEWEPRHRFVEEQIRGRYRLWSICTGFNSETEARLRTAMCGTLFRSIGSSTKLLCGQT